MAADQLVRRSDGSLLRRRAVGRLAFVRSSDPRHWHYLDFDRYELRSASGQVRVRRDRKTGFCRLAVDAGVRRRFAPHQLRHAHAVEMARKGCRST